MAARTLARLPRVSPTVTETWQQPTRTREAVTVVSLISCAFQLKFAAEASFGLGRVVEVS